MSRCKLDNLSDLTCPIPEIPVGKRALAPSVGVVSKTNENNRPNYNLPGDDYLNKFRFGNDEIGRYFSCLDDKRRSGPFWIGGDCKAPKSLLKPEPPNWFDRSQPTASPLGPGGRRLDLDSTEGILTLIGALILVSGFSASTSAGIAPSPAPVPAQGQDTEDSRQP